MTTVDQQTRRRIMRTGVTAYDRDLACPGHVLFNPNGGGNTIYLIDLEGRDVHRWNVPYPRCLSATIRSSGCLTVPLNSPCTSVAPSGVGLFRRASFRITRRLRFPLEAAKILWRQ